MAKRKKRRKVKRRASSRFTYEEDRARRVLDSFGDLEDFNIVKAIG